MNTLYIPAPCTSAALPTCYKQLALLGHTRRNYSEQIWLVFLGEIPRLWHGTGYGTCVRGPYITARGELVRTALLHTSTPVPTSLLNVT